MKNAVDHYFKVTYPQRLKELKAEVMAVVAKCEDNKAANEALLPLLAKFADTTKANLNFIHTHMHDGHEKYLPYVHRDFILAYLTNKQQYPEDL